MSTFTVGDTGTGPAVQPLESTDDRQSMGDGPLSRCSLPEVAAVVELAVQEPSLPTEGNLCQQQGTAAIEDKGSVSNTGGSHRGSGSSSGVESDTDSDDTDNTESVASSADLVAAYNSALEALKFDNNQKGSTFVWINKCQLTIRSLTNKLRKFSARVFASVSVGNVDVQSIIREGGKTPLGDNCERRFQVVEEYVLSAEEYFAARGNVKMEGSEVETDESDESDETEVTEVSSERMAANSSKDLMESMVVKRGHADTSGEMKSRRRQDGKTDTAEEELEVKRRRLDTSNDAAITLLKRNECTAEESAVEGVVATRQNVTSEDVTNGRGRDGRESQRTKDDVEKHGDQNATSSKDNGGDVEEAHPEPMAVNTSSDLEEVRLLGGDKHAGEEACKRAQVIRKLVIRQKEALSRITATAESRLFRLFRECHFLLTCVKGAGYVCNSALDAHTMAQVALQIAASSGTPDILGHVKEAAVTASQNTDMAVAGCEKAVQLHKDAVGVLERTMEQLFAVQDDKLLGERTVREATRVAEDVRLLVDRGDFNLDDLANKLSSMESMIATLSRAFMRAKGVNQITKQVARKFADAAFQIHVVAAVFGTTYFVLQAMTAATNALGSL